MSDKRTVGIELRPTLAKCSKCKSLLISDSSICVTKALEIISSFVQSTITCWFLCCVLGYVPNKDVIVKETENGKLTSGRRKKKLKSVITLISTTHSQYDTALRVTLGVN